MAKSDEPPFKVIADNRKARHEYFIDDVIEAGIALTGTEVKSLRTGRANISDAFAETRGNDMWLLNCHIAEYGHGNRFNHEPKRPRRLLMHRNQINKFSGQVKRGGFSMVPLQLYFTKKGLVKLELALVRGKKQHDKRATIKERDWQRDKQRLMRAKF